jgi:hypothetical protein
MRKKLVPASSVQVPFLVPPQLIDLEKKFREFRPPAPGGTVAMADRVSLLAQSWPHLNLPIVTGA